MKKILFIYSLIITLGLSFFFAFNSPSRTTLIISLLMLPIPAYFLITLTNPKEVNTPKWSFRILVVIFLLSFLGIISLKLLNTNSVQKYIQVENISPAPMVESTIKPTSNQDFTDILIEESKND